MEHIHAAHLMGFDHAGMAVDFPLASWDNYVAPEGTPTIFTEENFQQLMARDDLLDIAFSALENEDLQPILPGLQPTTGVPLTEEDFDRWINMDGAGDIDLPGVESAHRMPAAATAPLAIPTIPQVNKSLRGGFVPAIERASHIPAAATTQFVASAFPQVNKGLGASFKVPEVMGAKSLGTHLDSSAIRLKNSSDEANRRQASAANKVAKKPAARVASTTPRPARKKAKGKLATFILTGKTVNRVFNGTVLTSYYCSDGVIRILIGEALEGAKARTAAAKENGVAVEEKPAKRKRKAASAGSARASAKRHKAA